MGSINRFDRVTAILIQLQSRKTTKAQDLAERFGTSLRTIYRDIRSLEAAGVPVYGEAGLGYSLVDGYRLPPVLFSREEAAALLTAGKLVEGLAGPRIRADYKAALYKIRAVLREHDKDFLESIEGGMAVRKPLPKDPRADRPDSLPDILRGVAEKRVLALVYRVPGRGEETRRKVEPVGVFFDNANWHLIAYCRLRQDYRDFRLDRIVSLALLKEAFPDRHPPVEEVLGRTGADHALEQVILSVSLEAHGYLNASKLYHGFVSEAEKDGRMEMRFLTAAPDDFVHWYLQFAEHARVVAPKALEDKAKALLALKLSRL